MAEFVRFLMNGRRDELRQVLEGLYFDTQAISFARMFPDSLRTAVYENNRRYLSLRAVDFRSLPRIDEVIPSFMANEERIEVGQEAGTRKRVRRRSRNLSVG
jgi:hypothetical protein